MEKSHQCLAQQMDRLEGQVVKGLDIIWKSLQQQQKAWESGGALDLSRDRGERMGGEQGGSCGRVGTQGRGNDCCGRGEENEVYGDSCDIALLALLGAPNHDARSTFPNTSAILPRLEKYEPPTAQA